MVLYLPDSDSFPLIENGNQRWGYHEQEDVGNTLCGRRCSRAEAAGNATDIALGSSLSDGRFGQVIHAARGDGHDGARAV